MPTPNPSKDPSQSGQAVDYSDGSFDSLNGLKSTSKSTPLPDLRLPPLIKPPSSKASGVFPAEPEAVEEPPPPLPSAPPPSSPAAQTSPFVLEKWTQVSLPAVPAVPAAGGDSKIQPASFSKLLGLGAKSGSAPKVNLGRIGNYQLRQLIGEGGMGLVFQAEDLLLKRMVAVKIMKPDLAKARAAWRMFLKEAQATAAIKNDRIATIYQVGEHRDKFYLVMELLKGETLETRLKRGRMSLKQALWVAREAALGLAVAHDAGLVHRDIKPANLWLETKTGSSPQMDRLEQYRAPLPGENREADYGRLKILDFGLAQLVNETRGRANTSGTPGYMAPEQAAGDSGDERTDIFSLGVVLFRMVTGRMPFEGSTPMELLTAVSTQPAPLASAYNPGLPQSLVRLLQKMLSHDPVARPVRAADVALAIDRIDAELSPPAIPIKSESKRRAWPWVVAVTSLATVAFGILWIAYNRHNEADDVFETPPPASTKVVLSPSEVVDRIGDEVIVEFTVRYIQRAPDVAYIYESEPKPNTVPFRVAISKHLNANMRRRGENWPEALNGALLRLTGQVTRNGKYAEILVGDVEQFHKIIFAEKDAETK